MPYFNRENSLVRPFLASSLEKGTRVLRTISPNSWFSLGRSSRYSSSNSVLDAYTPILRLIIASRVLYYTYPITRLLSGDERMLCSSRRADGRRHQEWPWESSIGKDRSVPGRAGDQDRLPEEQDELFGDSLMSRFLQAAYFDNFLSLEQSKSGVKEDLKVEKHETCLVK